MPDLTVTPASVLGPAATQTSGIAGETIIAGQSLYLKSADSRLWKAQCDGTTEESTVAGISLHGATAGQPVVYAYDGVMIIGATTAKATPYMLSAAAGGICPINDLVATNKIVYIGYATDTTGTFTIFKRVTGAVV